MQAFQAAVYLLCFATSLLCLILLVRTYIHKRTRLLMWSALCFVGLAINNLLVFVDVMLLPDTIDLVPLRNLATLAALGVLLYGFIWESD